MTRRVRLPGQRERRQKVSMKYASRPPPGTPLDADDLKKRLNEVVTEREVRAERRRNEKAQQHAKQRGNAQPGPGGREKSSEESSSLGSKQGPSSLPLRPRSTRPQDKAEKVRKPISPPITSSEGTVGKNAQSQYVPEVAASQFTMTTTAEGPSKKILHKLSKKAMKFHMDGPNLASSMAAVAPSETTTREQIKALNRTQSAREKEYRRNQFQHSAILESAAELDDARIAKQANRHTFSAFLRINESGSSVDVGLDGLQTLNGFGGISHGIGGDTLPMGPYSSDTLGPSDNYEPTGGPDEHRVDWSQADEVPPNPNPGASSIRRGSDSRWKRLGGFTKSSSERGLIEANLVLPEPALRSSKSKFFSRFKL